MMNLFSFKNLSIGKLELVVVWVLLLALPRSGTAQESQETTDSLFVAKNPIEAFRHGSMDLHFRSFFMATDNRAGLSDYYALATGGGLHFKTAPLYGFRFGIAGVFNYNLASSDFTKKDPATGASNRYEIGLFDVEDPTNKNNLDRMEEFWLQYEQKKWRIKFGKQLLQTPFINYQDGRMRPTEVAGVWGQAAPGSNISVEGGWLWKISPRSTVDWYSVGRSIGLYPKGLNPDGSLSGYPENLESKGVALIGVNRKFGEHLKVQLWNQMIENISNTVFLQNDLQIPLKNGHTLFGGLQLMHQNALADGGNTDQKMTYFPKGAQSNALSTQLGWQHKAWKTSIAYTRVTKDGRFLTPREWGREPFYTFMSRERIEGSGDTHSITGKVAWSTNNRRLKAELAYGRFYLPDVNETALNKYAFPSFNQLNIDVRYRFNGWLDGLQSQLLVVHKRQIGDTYGQDKYVINRVDMWQYNFVLNYYL